MEGAHGRPAAMLVEDNLYLIWPRCVFNFTTCSLLNPDDYLRDLLHLHFYGGEVDMIRTGGVSGVDREGVIWNKCYGHLWLETPEQAEFSRRFDIMSLFPPALGDSK